MRLLADTQVLIWYVLSPEAISRVALDELTGEAADDVQVGVSAHALVETGYAAEKTRPVLQSEDVESILAVLDDEASPFKVLPADLAIARHVRAVPRSPNADPGDRIVVATAEVLGLDIVSSDGKMPAMTRRPVIW